MCAWLIHANVSDSEHNQQWRRGRGGGGACALGGTFQGWHFKEDKKISACVLSFKCFTALDVRPALEVFCDV